MDNWISVKKELPKTNEKFDESDYVLAFEDGIMPVVCWYSKKDGWRVAHYKSDSIPIQVTHWQPLPQPPKTKLKHG